MRNLLKSYLLTSLIVLSLDSSAINTASTGFRVTTGTTVRIDVHGICQDVTNSSSSDQFVATKTLNEWNNFLVSSPNGLTSTPCPINCTVATISNCTLATTPHGGSGGTCTSGYSGSCNYTCNNGSWNLNSNSCTLPSGCVTTTISNCRLAATSHGGSRGTCTSGYSGSCNYTCNNGSWSSNSNSCSRPPGPCQVDDDGGCECTKGASRSCNASLCCIPNMGSTCYSTSPQCPN